MYIGEAINPSLGLLISYLCKEYMFSFFKVTFWASFLFDFFFIIVLLIKLVSV